MVIQNTDTISESFIVSVWENRFREYFSKKFSSIAINNKLTDYIFCNVGWGTTEFAGPTSNILQKAKVSVINLSKCLNTFPNLVDSQMCTLGQGKDACQV